ITRDSKQAEGGTGALLYSYDVTPETVRALALPRALNLAGMRSVHLWVKCSAATAIAFSLVEQSGASYQTAFCCPKSAWQEVSLNLDELAPDDPSKDPDGKLDLDQVQALSLADLGQFFAAVTPGVAGARVMRVDE